MHKITKGLKKKKKGKKSKHKEEELFKPEELEAYRREHQQQHPEGEEPAASGGGEEWKKFAALTSGVDDILKKTQEDLDRIKSTSFFQRVPPPSEVRKQEEEARQLVEQQESEQLKRDAVAPAEGIVQVSESEEESEEDDDVFDTAYIDAIAAGEVKLAYIPESPTEAQTGDDPFDTSYAERAILGPAVERKGKKLVPIGAAVEVLTGRVQAPTCATKRPISHRRQILKERDLLLGSFDDNANSIPVDSSSPETVQKTLLDDDAPLPDEPIDLSKPIYIPPTPVQEQSLAFAASKSVSEFDVINKAPGEEDEDEDDEEFAILAAESLNKRAVVLEKLPITPVTEIKTENWGAFNEINTKSDVLNDENVENDVDPFDTTIADNILPGKAELKLIESEILNQENDIDFNPRAGNKLTEILNTVSIQVTNPKGQRESVSSLDRVSEDDLNFIKPIHRDLLGGSNTDLSNLNDQPLKPAEKPSDDYIEYCDPFDTSIVETVKLPGQTELKFLEKELLGEIKVEKQNSLSDDDFDPRADDKPRERTVSRPDVLIIGSVKAVSFDLSSPGDSDLLGAPQQAAVKKPLTPFYVRKNSVPGQTIEDDDINDDPFDTSFATDLGPGKIELKLIESELFNPETERHLSLSDQDFDPRDEKKVQLAQVVQTINQIYDPTTVKPTVLPFEEPKPIDLLATDHDDVSAKVLTPAAEKPSVIEEIQYSDPFDTSIAVNILPGKTELKLLESELINSKSQETVKRNLTDPEFDPRTNSSTAQPVDLLEPSEDIVIHKPLSPISGQTISFDIGTPEDIDPFDTSFANNIGPGKTELKLLESELI